MGACLVMAMQRADTAGTAGIRYLLLMSVALAYTGAAFARCDLGCPAEGSVRQHLHNLLGVAEYTGGGVAHSGVARFDEGDAKGKSKRAGACRCGDAAGLRYDGIATPGSMAGFGAAPR